MATIYTKINLAALVHKVQELKGKDGQPVRCIILPIKQNNLYLAQSGNVYLDTTGYEYTPEDSNRKETHIVKQKLSKEKYDQLSEEEKKAMPIIGNHSVFDFQENNNAIESSFQMPEDEEDDDVLF